MKTKKHLLYLMLVLALLPTLQPRMEAQVRHPGPRATCPICIAHALKRMYGSADNFIKLPRSTKTSVIIKQAPGVDRVAIEKILQKWRTLDLNKVRIDQDKAFATYLVEFGDGQSNNFYTIRNKSTGARKSGNKINNLLDQINNETSQEQSVYLLVDDVSDKKAQNFLTNVDLYNTKKQSDKLKAIQCDISYNEGILKRLGSTIVEPGARLNGTSEITRIMIKDIPYYKAVSELSVSQKAVKVTFFSKTKDALNKFLNKFRFFFRSTPETSIAKAINRTRLTMNSSIDAVFEEAGVTQFVQTLPFKSGCDKNADSKPQVISLSSPVIKPVRPGYFYLPGERACIENKYIVTLPRFLYGYPGC